MSEMAFYETAPDLPKRPVMMLPDGWLLRPVWREDRTHHFDSPLSHTETWQVERQVAGSPIYQQVTLMFEDLAFYFDIVTDAMRAIAAFKAREAEAQ